MTKSRIVLIALAICCLAMLGAGTAAYFTVQDTAVNVITTGILDMTLEEKSADGAEEGTALDKLPDFKDAFGVMPGETVSKIVYVDNTGTADFYTRIKVTTTIKGADGKELDTGVITLDFSEDWVEQDGWYYYKSAVTPGKMTTPLFTGVTFQKEMDNPYQNAEVTILVKAQSVQSKNNGTSWQTATGWPVEE